MYPPYEKLTSYPALNFLNLEDLCMKEINLFVSSKANGPANFSFNFTKYSIELIYILASNSGFLFTIDFNMPKLIQYVTVVYVALAVV